MFGAWLKIASDGVVSVAVPQLEMGQGMPESGQTQRSVPITVMAIHVAFLVAIVLGAHHPIVFMALLMLFIGYAHSYKHYQNPLLVREGLMVGFFLAGLVVLGGLQKWWLQDLLGGLSPTVLFWGATALTAVTDNAAGTVKVNTEPLPASLSQATSPPMARAISRVMVRPRPVPLWRRTKLPSTWWKASKMRPS